MENATRVSTLEDAPIPTAALHTTKRDRERPSKEHQKAGKARKTGKEREVKHLDNPHETFEANHLQGTHELLLVENGSAKDIARHTKTLVLANTTTHHNAGTGPNGDHVQLVAIVRLFTPRLTTDKNTS